MLAIGGDLGCKRTVLTCFVLFYQYFCRFDLFQNKTLKSQKEGFIFKKAVYLGLPQLNLGLFSLDSEKLEHPITYLLCVNITLYIYGVKTHLPEIIK